MAVIGLGLLGGSVCKGLKAIDQATRIIAYGRDPEKLAPALHDGAVDDIGPIKQIDLRGSDLVIVSTPVASSIELICDILGRTDLAESAVVIDVGSVKRALVRAALTHPRSSQFIGCHPMAGSEKTGYEHSHEKLFENASVIITPHASNREEDIGRVTRFWVSLGACVSVTTPELHDLFVAYTSHLPHVVAGSIAALLQEFLARHRPQVEIGSFIGNGFRDTTRIAAGSPEMWRDIVISNRDNIEEVLNDVIRHLQEFRGMLGDGDALFRYFTKTKNFRDGL